MRQDLRFVRTRIALTAVEKLHIDYEKGVVQIAYIDANDGSPVSGYKALYA